MSPIASRPNPRRLHPAHPYCAETNARASSWRETRTGYFGSPLGSLVEAPPPDRNILVLVDFQDLQDLAHPHHPDHHEYSPIRSTFFSNATGIEEQALFLWAQRLPGPKRWWAFSKLFPFNCGHNGVLTSMKIGWRFAFKTWMVTRNPSDTVMNLLETYRPEWRTNQSDFMLTQILPADVRHPFMLRLFRQWRQLSCCEARSSIFC